MIQALLVKLVLSTVGVGFIPPTVPPEAVASSPLVDGHSPVQVRLIAEKSTLSPNEAVRLGIHFTLAEGWHIYWQNPGGAGFPTEVSWQAEHLTLKPLHWPPPRLFHETDDIVTYGYSDEALLVVPAIVDGDAKDKIHLAADVKFLACNTICSPGSVHVERDFLLTRTSEIASPDTLAAFERFDMAPSLQTQDCGACVLGQPIERLVRMVLLALLGGIVLNLMPCVLPVLALKAFGLMRTQPSPKSARIHALGYLTGVLASMQALGLTVILLRLWGHRVGWGFQFQSPGFVAALAGVLLLLALNCFSVFELVVEVESVERAHSGARGFLQSVLEGVLAVLVSTPCSAPALGTAIAFALAQPGWVIALIFGAVGVGLALPFSLVLLVPGLRRRIPKPGSWMQVLKELFGFALVGTMLWLVWVFGQLTDADTLARLFGLLWLAALGAAAVGRAAQLRQERTLPGLSALLIVLVTLAWVGPLCLWPIPKAAAEAAEPMAYSQLRLEAELKAGHPVLVDFTADWCITCKFNERHVLGASAIRLALAQARVVTLKADWTKRDPALLAELVAHGRAGVPMMLLYNPRHPETPELLPEVLSVETLQRALSAL